MNKLRNPENGQYISKKQKPKAMPDVDVPKVIDIWFGGDEPEKKKQTDLIDELVMIGLKVAVVMLILFVTIYIGVRI
jgi:hypothetical protein